jgi:hypothetical protein
MRRAFLIALAALALAAPAAGGPTPAQTPATWATVNVCDTLAHPNEMGIRGSMNGMARKTAMYMRFRVQYRGDAGWRTLKTGPLTDSGWVRVAAGRKGAHDSGWSFRFEPPKSGGAHVVRGFVRFQWRRGSTVIARTSVTTTAGHPGTLGAEPSDFSAALCEIA